MSPFIFQCLLIFIAAVVVDYIWAKYTVAVTKHRALAAGLLAGAIIVCNSVVTLGYVNDWRLVVPAFVGAVLGTYLAVFKVRL